jgi:hypothetical protein
MGLFTIQILLPRTKTYPSPYFKILTKFVDCFWQPREPTQKFSFKSNENVSIFRIAKTAFSRKVLSGVRILLVPTVGH